MNAEQEMTFCNDSEVETLFCIKQLISFGSAE